MKSQEVKDLMEAYASIYMEQKQLEEGEQLDEGDLGDRARRVVGDQRGGYHGDADYFKKHQDAIDQRLLQMRPYGVKGFPSAKKDTKKTTQVAHFEPEGEQIAEMDIVGKLRRGLNKIGVKGTSSALEKESGADRESRRLGGNRMHQAEGDNTRPTPMKDDVDLFDIVKGYLVSEGATEEEVHDMMAHLTAEQIGAIVESGYFPTKESQREDEKKYKLSKDELPGKHKPQKSGM